MKKALISLFLIISLIVMPVLAQQHDGIVYITVEEAQRIALEVSTSYSVQDSYINEKVEAYDDLVDANNKGKTTRVGSFFDYFNSQINPKVNEASADSGVQITAMKKKNIKLASDYNIVNVFINIKKSQYALGDAKSNCELAEKNLDIANVRYNYGMITKPELTKAEQGYSAAQTQLQSAINNVNKQKQTLNKLLGRPLNDYNIEPVIELNIVELTGLDMNRIIKDYANNSMDMYQLNSQLKVAKQKYDLTKEKYDKYNDYITSKDNREDMDKAMERSERDYKDAQTSYDQKLKELEISISNQFETIKSLVSSINDLKTEIKISEDNISKDKIKSQLGLISKFDAEKNEINHKILVNKLQSSIADLNALYTGLTMYSK